jgi:hypothetical protein
LTLFVGGIITIVYMLRKLQTSKVQASRAANM